MLRLCQCVNSFFRKPDERPTSIALVRHPGEKVAGYETLDQFAGGRLRTTKVARGLHYRKRTRVVKVPQYGLRFLRHSIRARAIAAMEPEVDLVEEREKLVRSIIGSHALDLRDEKSIVNPDRSVLV